MTFENFFIITVILICLYTVRYALHSNNHYDLIEYMVIYWNLCIGIWSNDKMCIEYMAQACLVSIDLIVLSRM